MRIGRTHSYAGQTTEVSLLVSSSTLANPPIEIWRFDVPAERSGAEEVSRAVLEFTQELRSGIEFTLDVRRKYISWGTDASAFEVIVMINASIFSTLAATAIQEKINQLRRRLSKAEQGAEPVSRDQERPGKTTSRREL
jgi:hypothetical protein